MARLKLVRRVAAVVVLVVVVGGAWFIQNVKKGIEPLPEAATPKYERFEKVTALPDALKKLQSDGVIKDANAMRFYAIYRRDPSVVSQGTYAVHPGMDADAILSSLHKPIKQMVRIPETNWSNRTGRLLEKKDVVVASEYSDLVKKPSEFKNVVSFPLPATSLEGYLWPDTYDLPPMVGARAVIERQLKAFEKKVWLPLGKPEKLERTLIIASLIELEVARDEERRIVAGIIENRLKKGMPLQLDATILYAQDRWHEPTGSDIRKTISPYNTYKHKGLPPTPVCSPSLKSIEAAMHPGKNDYLYYVALPDGHSLFAKTAKEHQVNIGLRKTALAVQKTMGVSPR